MIRNKREQILKIKIEKLNIKYGGDTILKEFDLTVNEGEFVTVLGRSGSGKTTLLNTIAGTIKPESGTVSVDGKEVLGITSHVAYMPKDDLLLPWKNIYDNVTLYARINPGHAVSRDDTLRSLDDFGLKGYEFRYPAELSGGMRQRAAFLRTSLCGADILLLDEPFASLDIITRKDMQKWLLRMKSHLGRTVLMVTHDVDEALLLSDRIIVIGGRPAVIKREYLPGHKKSADELKGEIWEIL